MAGHYRERIDDDRLVAVVNLIRHWLFGQQQGPQGNTTTPASTPIATTNVIHQQGTGDSRPVLRLYVG
jgi:hypothetical protein